MSSSGSQLALGLALGAAACGGAERYGEPTDPAGAPVASIDRFGDQAVLFRRGDPMFHPEVVEPILPGPNEPIDMDALFLVHSLGPDGEAITYYGLDVQAQTPARAFVVVGESGAEIEGQLPIVERLPGEEGYSDFVQIHEVNVGDDYPANALTSVAEVEAVADQGLAVVVATSRVANWALVPAGSTATRRFDGEPVDGFGAWHDDEVVSLLKFDRQLELTSGGGTPLSNVIVIFEDGMSPAQGFATEGDSAQTHNVVQTLPGDEDYSSLWQHRMGDRAGFDGVTDWDSAVANTTMLLNILVNCPVVAP